MSETAPQARPEPPAPPPATVPMRDLLASCAAARAVSTPPPHPAGPAPRRAAAREAA